ncbi:hypothetical protein [Mucilaginibacter sp. CSA2-8R]|uniref:hypothetical protein n=1 Tax=Mucilaginibacter sp. CSA2-8R TaxID=3141542 RepID=UPI00315D5393
MKLGNTGKWLFVYGILLGAVVLFNVLPGFKSGPCTPNLDVLSFLLVGLTTAILMVRGVVKYYTKAIRGKILLINIIGFAAWCFIMFVL